MESTAPDLVGVRPAQLPAQQPAERPEESRDSCALTAAGDVLTIHAFGATLGKHSERLQVRLDREVVCEAPLFRLREVLVTSRGVQLSSDALLECGARGISVHIVGARPEQMISLTTPVGNATAATRRQQLLAYLDDRGARYARAFVSGKLQNQANFLKYTAKYRKDADRALHLHLRDAAVEIEDLARAAGGHQAADVETARMPLLNLEARAGRRYWQAVALLLEARFPGWPGRQHRGTQEPFNAALNYGYAVLASQVHTALLLAGLDASAGFLHTDRAGKLSLVYDAVEEFRQPVVDRPLLGLVNRGMVIQMEDGLLDRASRQRVAGAVLERLDASEVYGSGRNSLRTIISRQAQHLATFLRRERDAYLPFVSRW